MNAAYVVRTLPVRDANGIILGWVRADLFADGTKPTDMVVLRDGFGYGQAEAAQMITREPGLLFPTREEAVRDGFALLRKADARDRAATKARRR